jgi:putative nucleotidyltransferase with HDIG domain
MRQQKAADVYIWAVACIGIGFAILTTAIQAPTDLVPGTHSRDILVDAAILVVLTFLSSISPVQTKLGATVTVGLAPMFGAFLTLPPWALMWVAALGTVDERLPGRGIPWNRFLFNRGMSVIQYGVPSLIFWSTGYQGDRGAWYWVLPIAVVAIVALNVGQVSLVFSLLQGISPFTSAKKMVSGHGATYIAMPLIGYLIYILISSATPASRLVVFLLYGPVLVYRASLQKQQRLDQWLRDSFIMQSRIVDKRDGQTFGHSQRVGELSEAVARRLHLNEGACNTIRVAGILHDLGKIAIPDSILLKPARLTPEEYEIIKTHPVEGANILAEHPEQRDVAAIVLHHHEKWDGSGYPDGQRQEEIPIGARIVDACDAYDTITQARVFRPTVKTPFEAIRELSSLAGKWYDPAVVRALEEIAAERWAVPLEQAPSAERKSRDGYFEVLANRAFRLLWLGQGVSYFGDMMNTTGLAIMLYLVTRSPSLVALGLIAKAAPTILFGLIAGAFVDRFNRQRLMIGSDLVRAVLTLTIPFFAYSWLPGVFLAVFLIASASAFFNPAKQALLPNLVPPDHLVRANSLVSSSEKTMELLGYSTAGLIAGLISWAPLFVIDSATYLISAVTLLGVPDLVRRAKAATRTHLFEDVLEGARYILSSPPLRSTMALTFTAVFFAGMTFPILVILAYGPLHGGAFGYGILEAAIGAGAMIGALLAPAAMSRLGAGILILAGVAGMGASYALTGFSQALWLAGAFLFAGGIANTIYYVPLISITQREASDRMGGRVMAARFLLVQLGLLGGIALAGPLAYRVGAQVVFVAAGGLMILAALAGVMFPTLRDATLRDEPIHPVLKARASG